MKEVKMYSDFKSPFAYLAFEPGFALERRYQVKVSWKPFQLRVKDKGQRSLYSEYKTRYSYLDARRSAKARGLVIRSQLKVYDTRIALIGGLFAQKHGQLLPFNLKVYELFWKRELIPDDADQVATLVTSFGLSADEFRQYLAGEGAGEYDRLQEEAAADHIFGVPIFVFEYEPFWGYDRIPMLEERLAEAGLGRLPTA
ncbi:MAG: nahD 1 [Candidatus Binatus sp.]|nr:nahD 1 [Candidatus Binatus sp.]